MRTNRIVLLLPREDFLCRVVQRCKAMKVQTFVAKSSVERFNEGILCRLARRDEFDPHAFFRPLLKHSTAKFRTVVDSYASRQSSMATHSLEHLRYLPAAD